MWKEIIEVFQKYTGTGLVFIWFLASMGYLYLKEQRTSRRILFIYSPLIILLLFFNPLFYKVFAKAAGEEIYFRMFWMIPVIIVVSYAAIQLLEEVNGKHHILMALITVFFMAISGKLVYSSPLFHMAENSYHVSQSVVDICDAIIVPGREVMAVFPKEMLLEVRQYTPFVCMPYGRQAWEGSESCAFYEYMEEEQLDLEKIEPYVTEYNCHFIVVKEEKEILGNPQDLEWEIWDRQDGYVIYRNNRAPL